MTPLQFEQVYQAEWAELETLLDRVIGRNASGDAPTVPVHGDRLAALYRLACEHLALSRARAYPPYIVDRLERMTADAHQLIYRRNEFGLARLKELIAVDFPSAVRKQAPYVAVAAAVFVLPAIVIALLVYWRPELILAVVSSETAASFEEMYSPAADSIGRNRTATTDWMMFGFYIYNNVSVAFQCFAGGLFAGIGTLFFLAYNGAFSGALAGYLTERGLASTFYSFVATHSSFELTAVVLSGAAGLRIGHSLLAPKRLTRMQSLLEATRECSVVLYGMTAMLFVAAAVEAFWSSASWLPPAVKYVAATGCWTAVLGYLTFQGRRAG
ncbi:MAG TPA: stage II sporulation protein M [Vicinamibacterales bacterium]|nr:stage II sporulation protein M [Vicinamibacterales bacterium]